MAMTNFNLFLYGRPGTGKSTFASNASKPFFICTDKNYSWLGLPEKDHVQVTSWAECIKAFSETYDGYDTIVVDLIEDCFRLCEEDYCKRNKIDYVGNKGYGEGWRVTRDSFLLALSRLDSLVGKNIIFISHETSYTFKDKRGVETTTYTPNKRLPDDVMDQLEGRFRFVLRCYMTEELVNNKFVKRRYLSMIPKPEETYSIARGIDEANTPADIALDYDTFVSVIGLKKEHAEKQAKPEPKPEPKEEPQPEPKQEAERHVEQIETVEQPEVKAEEPHVETKEERLARLRKKYGAN